MPVCCYPLAPFSNFEKTSTNSWKEAETGLIWGASVCDHSLLTKHHLLPQIGRTMEAFLFYSLSGGVFSIYTLQYFVRCMSGCPFRFNVYNLPISSRSDLRTSLKVTYSGLNDIIFLFFTNQTVTFLGFPIQLSLLLFVEHLLRV